MSASELGRRIGLSQVQMSRRTRGAVPFTVPEVVAVAQVLEIPVAELFEPAA